MTLHPLRRLPTALASRILTLTAAGACALCLLPAQPSSAGSANLGTINFSAFGGSGLIPQADDLGFFAGQGLQVNMTSIQSSEQQAQDLIAGRWDIVSTNADNVVYWDDELGADAVIFMISEGPVTQDLYVGPGINSLDDLRGATLAVDSIHSGYATVLRKILLDAGLVADVDYQFLPVGNTALRTTAILNGQAAGAMLGAASDEALAAGVHDLAHGADYAPVSAANTLVTTRRFAADHPDLLLAFIRAQIQTLDFLADPSNADAAIASFARTGDLDTPRATEAYQQTVAAMGSRSVADQVNADAMQAVLDLRAEVGLIPSPPPAPSAYLDASWYRRALASLR